MDIYMNKLRNLKGSIVSLVTPFSEDGTVNFKVLTELIEFQIAEGTDAILILGTTGEASCMTHEEDDEIIAHTVKVVAGRIPVIAGTGSNCTKTMVEKSLRAEEMGADGVLLVSPYFVKTNTEGMYHHFLATLDKINIPCILHSVPGRTGSVIPISIVEKLATHPKVCGIKEASDDLGYAMKIANFVGPDFSLYTGNDDSIRPILAIGGSGAISAIANVVPRETHNLVMKFLEGDREGAHAINDQLLRLINDLCVEVNPIPVKTALNMMGFACGPFRLPLYKMEEQNREILCASLKDAGLL